MTTDVPQEELDREVEELLTLTGQEEPDKSISEVSNDHPGDGGFQREGVLPTDNIEIKVPPSYDKHKRRFLSDELTGIYCPHCGQWYPVADINRTMGGKVYRIKCRTHGIVDVELWD